MSEAWLQDLKPGDEVIVTGRGCRIARVERVTAQQVVLVGGQKFWKESRREVGIEHTADYIRQCTPEEKRDLKNTQRSKELASDLRSVFWWEVSLDKLERIKTILDEPEAP